MKIRVVVSGRDYHATATIPGELTLPEGASVDAALEALESVLPRSAALPGSCLIAVCGAHLGTRARHSPAVLRDGDELLVLAPIAGG